MSDVKAGERKLTAAVVQHALTGRVLMLGYMDDEALALTRSTGLVHFWSRSRQRLWKKGESSGNVLQLVDLKADCDADAWLVRALPAGPTCHTGATSCFGTDGIEPAPTELEALYQTIVQRKAAPDGTRSYVKSLFATPDPYQKIGAKIVEEAGEFVAELPGGARERVIAEAADLVFHALVGLVARDVTLEDVARELHRRAGVSGLDEKDARAKSPGERVVKGE
ncbi:MAG TPA: bifunctional phosphoribosyl-AMP cyclohydrolase/phosphoribosyl-ATP diphosphatase HisIE [Polyangia bacterium]|jgi:phosphoribosyl-ATP pyrophosphohydrolase/phosphoribosyl-AMP cyclohydrolase|nr:bifunctional phosphoribosyl-AMP cyclohydrolase/phosphoribosyl-ATP diphosphatase HisIE [Polyangia bacterium]